MGQRLLRWAAPQYVDPMMTVRFELPTRLCKVRLLRVAAVRATRSIGQDGLIWVFRCIGHEWPVSRSRHKGVGPHAATGCAVKMGSVTLNVTLFTPCGPYS